MRKQVKERKTRKYTKKISHTSILSNSLKVFSSNFPSDPTSPGVLISHLRSGQFYCSIKRYQSSFGNGAYNLTNFKADTLEELIIKIGKYFTHKQADPRRTLEQEMGKYLGFSKDQIEEL